MPKLNYKDNLKNIQFQVEIRPKAKIDTSLLKPNREEFTQKEAINAACAVFDLNQKQIAAWYGCGAVFLSQLKNHPMSRKSKPLKDFLIWLATEAVKCYKKKYEVSKTQEPETTQVALI